VFLLFVGDERKERQRVFGKWCSIDVTIKLMIIDGEMERVVVEDRDFFGFYLQITNLRTLRISPASLYTFLKIEVNHWEILEMEEGWSYRPTSTST
jgi:hypothetical protein